MNKIAYVLNYTLPISNVVPVNKSLNLNFLVRKPFSKEKYIVEHTNVGDNLQSLIDNFFNDIKERGISYSIENNTLCNAIKGITTLYIDVTVIGIQVDSYLEQLELN